MYVFVYCLDSTADLWNTINQSNMISMYQQLKNQLISPRFNLGRQSNAAILVT